MTLIQDTAAIPLKEAQLCLDCDHITRVTAGQVCGYCSGKSTMPVSPALGGSLNTPKKCNHYSGTGG